MLTLLSAKYQKEIALGFISLFLLSGLSGIKAREAVNNHFNNYYNTNNFSKKSTNKSKFNNSLFINNEENTSINNTEYVNKKNIQKNYQNTKNTRTTIPEVKSAIKKITLQPAGGPGQPEMSSFKPVEANNMVDLFTGDFSYNIPLLDVGGYPINLFYNSGITMDQEASWVGLGWNINPGTIMRNMRGLPDEFNGEDTILKRQSMRPDKTWGVSAGAGLKLFGFPKVGLNAGVNINAGVSFNNKLGVATEIGINPAINLSINAKDEKTAGLSFGAELNASSRNGASITPSIKASLTQSDGISGISGSLGASYTYSSRMGLQGMHLDAGISKSKVIGERDASKAYKVNELSGSLSTFSSSLSFAYPTIVPSIKNTFTRKSYNLSFSLGGEIYGVNPHPRISGYYAETYIAPEDQLTRHPAYGMLHYQKANNEPGALLDFNRMNEGVYTPNSPAIALPVYTYDVFSINGEGVGGSFRATRSDVGYMRDAFVSSKDDAYSLGVDLGFGGTLHGGAEISYVHTPSEAGAWKVSNIPAGMLQFKENNKDSQFVYFKNPGEKTIPDANFQKAIGEENMVRFKMANIGSGSPMLLPNLVKFDETKNKTGELEINKNNIAKASRDKRTQVISFLTAEEATRVGFDKFIHSYNPDESKVIFGPCNKEAAPINRFTGYKEYAGDDKYRKAHHISEIDVLGADGRKYVYGIPVYNTKQVDVSFSTDNGNNNTGKSKYKPDTDDSPDNTKGRDWYMQQDETPAYPHSFLLTELISPNYVDVTGDGVTEDDMGDAIKFNYSKYNNYKWRTPLSQDSASYSEGLKTDNKDDKAHYVYGEREMWYLYSIESKNMVARFYVKNDRKDGRQVKNQHGGVDPNWGMQRLDKICLFSKGDLMKLGAYAKPIKTIQFFQSYKLCKNTDGSTNSIVGSGKLTLDSIWVSYNNNQKKTKNKYAFYYPQDKNPDYNYNYNDRWGNYKPVKDGNDNNPAGLNNADYPYSIQDKTKADKYAAAWVMNKILLPSGGTINVDYESDDYAYVQNKRAAGMYQILGFGNTNNPDVNQQKNKNIYTGNTECDYVYVQLPFAITGNNAIEQQKQLLARYFENTKQLYMRLAVVMPPKPGLSGSENIPVYADIENVGLVPNTEGKIAYVKVKKLDNGQTPMVQQALQFLKQQLPGKAYPGYDVSENGGLKGVIMALAGMVASIMALQIGEDNVLKLSKKCREVETAKSFARLTNPYFTKYGGGLRVKRVTINDNWNKMTGQYDATYGQEYKYTTTEMIGEKLTTVSSGVASWEPSIGSDENPHKEIMRFMNHNKGGPYDFGAVEMPLGEAFYPSPLVGYSRVEVLSIHRDTVKNLPTRQVTEFYTTKDFPFKSACTPLTDPEANAKYEPKAIIQLLKLDMKKNVTQSQGFLVEMNDMNGKTKTQAVYSALDSVNAISYTHNFYNVKKTTDNTYQFNHLFPTINKADGIVNPNSLIGRDIELMADFRQHFSKTVTKNISVNFDFFILGILPIPVTNILQPFVNESTIYRSAALLKIVNHYGILDSVVNIDKLSMVSTKNLVYDAETGNPVITRTNNEHDKPVYQFNYPAHWAYSGMGPAYKNIDAVYENCTFRKGLLETPIDMSVFESGDELYVFSENNKGPKKQYPCDVPSLFNNYLPKNTENRIWVVNTAKGGSIKPQFVFMDAYGNPYTAENVSVRIIRSGHRNMLDQTVGSITSMNNPINGNGQLVFDNNTNVIQATAATFKDHWRVDNDFYAKDSIVTQTKWAPIKTTILHPNNSYSLGLYRSDCNGCNYQATHFPKPEYFLARKQSFGYDNYPFGPFPSRRKQKSWISFDLDTLNLNTTIVSAKLNLYAHSHIDFKNKDKVKHYFFYQNTHGNENSLGHTSINPHTYWNTSNNNFVINRMLGKWSPDYSSDWQYKHFDGLQGNGYYDQVVVTGTQPLNSSNKDYINDNVIDNSIELTGILTGMIKDKFNLSKQYTPAIKISMLDQNDYKHDAKVCFFAKGVNLDINSAASINAPLINVEYYDCTKAYSYGYIPTPDEKVAKCSDTSFHAIFCLSKFTKKAMNPYVEGILGNWRADTTFTYLSSRKETDPTQPIDTRTAGAISNFKNFWLFANPYLKRNTTANDVWIWNSTITQFNRKGYEIENKDPLGRYNSGLYGYNQHLPVASVNNARVREIMYDGFEDYDYQTAINCISCKPHRHINFKDIEKHIDASEKHSGQYSLRVNAWENLAFQAPVVSIEEADKRYGLRIKIDSFSYKITKVLQKGTGLTAKYLKYPAEKNNKKMMPKANAALANIDNNPFTVTRIDPNVNLGNSPGMYPPPANIGWGNFVARWRGYLQAPVSGEYSFMVHNNDCIRLWINGVLKINNWDPVNPSVGYSTITLNQGQVYNIQVDYVDTHAGGFGNLFWKTPDALDYVLVPKGVLYSLNDYALTQNNIITTTYWCTRLDSSQVFANALTDTFAPIQGKKMLLSGWVKENTNDCKCSSYVNHNITISYEGTKELPVAFKPAGSIIEGWQRYESAFIIPSDATQINIQFNNNTNVPVFFDDIRLHPFNANMKSLVYHSSNLRLVAELDENNYSTFYEYDDDGTLIRVKKETEQGIKTITETRSALQKTIQ